MQSRVSVAADLARDPALDPRHRPALGDVPAERPTFVMAALLCHGALADDRPEASHLTEFYLWISFGGMLGGLFNGLAAPVLFTGVWSIRSCSSWPASCCPAWAS